MFTEKEIINLFATNNKSKFYNDYYWRMISKSIRQKFNNECQLCKSKRKSFIYDKDTLSNEYVQKYANYPRQVLNFKCQREGLHPTQKPVDLFEYLIKTYTNENDLVLDNCMGSGTTAIACLNTNRQYIGFELDGIHYNTATERILNHGKEMGETVL